MRLTLEQEALLRSLALFSNKGIQEDEVEDFEILEAAGFAISAGSNGCGIMVGLVTKLGVLKALAAGLIPKHPDAELPAAATLAQIRRDG